MAAGGRRQQRRSRRLAAAQAPLEVRSSTRRHRHAARPPPGAAACVAGAPAFVLAVGSRAESVTPGLAATVLAVHVEEGEMVEHGQLLATLEADA